MKNNTVNIMLISLIVIIFLGYFIILDLILANVIIEQLRLAEYYTRNENWNDVTKIANDIKKSWNIKKYYIMINFAEAEYTVFENHINYIIGGAEGKQLDTTLSNILAAQDIWKYAIKFVPEP